MSERENLERLARAAIAQRPHCRDWWTDVAQEVPTAAERAFMEAASPAAILRLLRQVGRTR